ncbi:hypothetical protein DENSPDRAFT_851682 [Dentipellis sp. KUC8613]|nr:hypothetical protein DENSPDRAFT_851682 [Dentipellis sp. KUC8613]
MFTRAILDSSPIRAPPPTTTSTSNPLKRSASTASLPTPPRTIKKRSRSRGSVFEDSSDDDDHALPALSSDREDGPDPAPQAASSSKRRKIDDLVAELSSEDREEAFWLDGASSSTAAAQPKSNTFQRRRIPGAEKVHPRPASSRRVSASRTRPFSLLTPPTTRHRPPVTPPRRTRAGASTPSRKASGKVAPVRDSPNNPFLADSPASLPSSPLEPRTPTHREEKPTLTYVFRGKKQEFMNPHFGVPRNPRSLLKPEHPDFSPSDNCTPRELFPHRARGPTHPVAVRGSTSRARLTSPDPWDSDDDGPGGSVPRITLAKEFEKAGVAAEFEEGEGEEEPKATTKRPARSLPARVKAKSKSKSGLLDRILEAKEDEDDLSDAETVKAPSPRSKSRTRSAAAKA